MKSSKRSTSNQTIKIREEIKKKCRGIEGMIFCVWRSKMHVVNCNFWALAFNDVIWLIIVCYIIILFIIAISGCCWLLLVSGSSHSFVVLIFHLMHCALLSCYWIQKWSYIVDKKQIVMIFCIFRFLSSSNKLVFSSNHSSIILNGCFFLQFSQHLMTLSIENM